MLSGGSSYQEQGCSVAVAWQQGGRKERCNSAAVRRQGRCSNVAGVWQ